MTQCGLLLRLWPSQQGASGLASAVLLAAPCKHNTWAWQSSNSMLHAHSLLEGKCRSAVVRQQADFMHQALVTVRVPIVLAARGRLGNAKARDLWTCMSDLRIIQTSKQMLQCRTLPCRTLPWSTAL
jgi:hypothetical protein